MGQSCHRKTTLYRHHLANFATLWALPNPMNHLPTVPRCPRHSDLEDFLCPRSTNPLSPGELEVGHWDPCPCLLFILLCHFASGRPEQAVGYEAHDFCSIQHHNKDEKDVSESDVIICQCLFFPPFTVVLCSPVVLVSSFPCQGLFSSFSPDLGKLLVDAFFLIWQILGKCFSLI